MTHLFSVMARNRSLEGLSGIISMKFKGKRYIKEEDWKKNPKKTAPNLTANSTFFVIKLLRGDL